MLILFKSRCHDNDYHGVILSLPFNKKDIAGSDNNQAPTSSFNHSALIYLQYLLLSLLHMGN